MGKDDDFVLKYTKAFAYGASFGLATPYSTCGSTCPFIHSIRYRRSNRHRISTCHCRMRIPAMSAGESPLPDRVLPCHFDGSRLISQPIVTIQYVHKQRDLSKLSISDLTAFVKIKKYKKNIRKTTKHLILKNPPGINPKDFFLESDIIHNIAQSVTNGTQPVSKLLCCHFIHSPFGKRLLDIEYHSNLFL